MSKKENSNSIRWIDTEMISDLTESAQAMTRRRLNLNFHATLDENPHRFLNCLLKGTYIRPHRHLYPPKPESFVLLQGCLLFVIFDDDGTILDGGLLASAELLADKAKFDHNNPAINGRTLIKPLQRPPAVGVDIDPGLWHTLIPVSNVAIIFEVKPGPYSVADDKEFASWAPKEQPADEASRFLAELENRCLAD